MANFDLLKIKSIKDKDLDLPTKSNSANGTLQVNQRFTKIRKEYTLTFPISTYEEKEELKTLYDIVRTTESWTWDIPLVFTNNVPTQVTVRFKEPIEIEMSAEIKNHWKISTIVLEEV